MFRGTARRSSLGRAELTSLAFGAGGPDVNKGAKYILWRFTQLNRARLSIYPHLTQATDTSNVSHIDPQVTKGI